MELDDDQFSRLGLSKVADLTGYLAENSRSYRVQDLQGRPDTVSDQLVIKTFDLSSIPDATVTWDTGRWSTGGSSDWIVTQKHPTNSNKSAPKKQEVSDEAITELLQFNWVLGENSLGIFTPSILEVGMIDKTPYLLREYYSKSLQSLIETRLTPTHDLLFHLAESAWSALAFLHQTSLNVPHGNLKASNILIAEGNLKSAPIILADAVKTQETIRRGEKTRDLQNLGAILLQFLTSEKSSIPIYEALNRAENANYERLGKQSDKWKTLLCRLLNGNDLNQYPETGVALKEWLADLRSPKSTLPNIPEPKAPSPAGPNLGGSAEKEETETATDLIDALIKEENYSEGFQLALESYREVDDDNGPPLMERLNFCVALLSDSDLATEKTFLSLQEAATLDSSPAALRLGQAYLSVHQDSDLALEWLEKAAESGEVDALAPIASLYENGTSTHSPQVDKALSTLNLLAEKCPGPDKQHAIAALILRGQTSQLLSEAVTILEDASSQGYFKSTDLLGQIYATGHGAEIDEKKAYELFAQAWKESKKTNSHYYTASNNLGVCLGLGFGSAQDLGNARVYFQQGAGKKHAASIKNLNQMS